MSLDFRDVFILDVHVEYGRGIGHDSFFFLFVFFLITVIQRICSSSIRKTLECWLRLKTGLRGLQYEDGPKRINMSRLYKRWTRIDMTLLCKITRNLVECEFIQYLVYWCSASDFQESVNVPTGSKPE